MSLHTSPKCDRWMDGLSEQHTVKGPVEMRLLLKNELIRMLQFEKDIEKNE